MNTEVRQRRGPSARRQRATAAEAPVLGTRDRLKQSAKRLFASRGFDGVAVRDILTEAREKNGASISYYFGSKEGLIEEIIAELFSELDAQWTAGLQQLPRDASIRDLVTLIVEVSTTFDSSSEPTASRLAEAASHQRFHVVQNVMKRLQLRAYDRILGRIADQLSHLPTAVLRQRLVFFTRYASSIFSLYESTQITGSAGQRRILQATYDLGNVIDTAVGLLTAEVVSAGHLNEPEPVAATA